MLPTPPMTLFHSPTSPFARKVRIVLHERGLWDQTTEAIAQIRTPDNEVIPYSPTGKIPALSVEGGPDKGLVLVESTTICDYLEQFGDAPPLQPVSGPAHWREKALDGYAHAFLDSIAWRGREGKRVPEERSPGFVALEVERQQRCFVDLEARVDKLQAEEITLSRILFALALDFYEFRIGEDWRPGHPRLSEWQATMAARPSFQATTPW